MATKRVVTPDNLSNSYFDIGENTSNQIEYKLPFTISRLKTSTNLPPVVFITDNTKEGLFEYDNTDTTTVGDDVDVIVTNTGRRYKRKTSTTTEVLSKLDKGYTIAQLRTLSDSKVTTIGLFYCIDVGKEGWFKYDSTDTTSTDNLGTILVTSGGKRLKRIINDGCIYPEWFGADNTGTNNSTTALQNAINFCSTQLSHIDADRPYNVKLNKGVYKITNIILHSGVSLKGCGRMVTRLLAVGTNNDWTLKTTPFTFGTMSYETSLEGFSINGNPSLNFTDLNFTPRPNIKGIGLFSNTGMYIRDVSVYNLSGTGVGYFTSQDISNHNLEVLHCGLGLDFGRYDGDIANAIHFTGIRIEKNDVNMNIGDNLDQVRDINFSSCKFEEGLINIKSCAGIMFNACSFMCSIVGDYTIKIIAGTGVDTRCITFNGCFFTSPYNKQTKAIQANSLGTNPVVVSGCSITGLDKYAFDGDIVFTNNTLYDVNVPYISVSNKGFADKNKAYAVNYTDETVDFYGEVKNKETYTRTSVLNLTTNLTVTDVNITGNTIYKNVGGDTINVTGYVKVLTNDSTSYLFVTRVGNSSSALLDGYVASIPSNASTINTIIPFTIKVKPGQYFQFFSTNTSAVNLVGATIN